MKKLFKVTFVTETETRFIYAAAQDWERVASTYENATIIELISAKVEVIKDREGN